MPRTHLKEVFLLFFARFVVGVQVFQRLADLPHDDYDFIIVGGGTAGAVVGSRLGEELDYNILIIEAGPS
jgi:choline dehydrogenase